MIDTSPTEQIVMKRVRRIRLLLLILSTATLAALTAVAALWGIGKEVWVARVFSNGPQDLMGHIQYLAYAFWHTTLLVQTLSLLTFISFVFLARELARMILGARSSR